MATYKEELFNAINSGLKGRELGWLDKCYWLNSLLMHGFLNPLGKHYQGNLFLEEFLESVGLKEWFGDSEYANVRFHEYGFLYYYCERGKHIIIHDSSKGEEDLHINLEEYCEEFERDFEYRLEKNDELAVIYIAPYKKTFSKESLGEWEIQGDYLVNGDNKVRFKSITFDNEILKWIEKSIAEVSFITKLNATLLFYKNIAQIITTNTDESTKDIEKLLTDNNLEENIKILCEILSNKERLIDSYCEAIAEKYEKQLESRGFEIAEVNNDLAKYTYPLIIKPKDCGEYYFAFCIETSKYNDKPVNYGVQLFKQDSDYIDNFMINRISRYLGIRESRVLFDPILLEDGEEDEEEWWWGYQTETELESELQEFLDSNKIKEFNDELKPIQAYCDAIHEIKKTIENNYKDYVMTTEEDEEYWELGEDNYISVWHKDFNDEKLYFSIDMFESSQSIFFQSQLHGLNIFMGERAFPILKEVLGVDDSAFREGSHCALFAYLTQGDKMNPKDLTKERFMNFFESMREQVYSFNQKIKDDLAKGQDSKLRKFL